MMTVQPHNHTLLLCNTNKKHFFKEKHALNKFVINKNSLSLIMKFIMNKNVYHLDFTENDSP